MFTGPSYWVDTGLPVGHNTLRRHPYIMGLIECPLFRKCGAEEENSSDVLCECGALGTFRQVYLGSFLL